MTNHIRFTDKSGKVKFIADDKGTIKEVDNHGKLHDIRHKDSGKEEIIEITPDDMKE